MSTIIQKCGETQHGYDRRIHMKGAAEQVLENCTYYLNQNGEKEPMTNEKKRMILEVIADYES